MADLTPNAAAVAKFRERRFGLFVHWGLYAAAARGEWVRHVERTTDDDYQQYSDNFDPDLYDPQSWADQAANEGMRYSVITTKHHDGFCLYDSALQQSEAHIRHCGTDHARCGRQLAGCRR